MSSYQIVDTATGKALVTVINMQEGLYWADCHMCGQFRRLDHAVAWYCGPTHDEIGSVTTEYTDGGIVGGMCVCKPCHDAHYAIQRCDRSPTMSAIKQIDIGYIGRSDGVTGESFEPTDEALIFLNDDNEQIIHVQAPNAKEIAAEIILAVRAFLPPHTCSPQETTDGN